MSVRVLVCDDHPVVRAGLVMVLGLDAALEVVGEADDGLTAVEAAAALRPDIVLMDLQMPGIDGVEATRRIVEGDASARVLILTTYDHDRSIVAAVEAGAAGYLTKDAPPDELLAAVKTAAAGGTVLSPELAAVVEAARRAPTVELSDRELEVLACVADGCTNAAAAERLHVSVATVKTHLVHVFQKLQVDDRTSAVMKAIELGLIEH